MSVPSAPRRQWTDAQIELEVRRIAAEQAGVPVEEVMPVSRLVEDLEFDSLDHTEMIMTVEDVFDLKIDDAEPEVQLPKSVGDVIAIVRKHLSK